MSESKDSHTAEVVQAVKDADQSSGGNRVEAEPGKRRQRPPKTAEIIAQRIAGEITDRDLRPGTVLSPEKEMLTEYGVGRGSLREALRLLEQQGVISLRPGPNGGPVVADPDPRNLARLFALLLQSSRTPFRYVVQARELIEPPVAQLAAELATEEETAAIRRAASAMAEHVSNLEEFLHWNTRFHAVVAEASHNTVLAYIVSSLHWITDGTPLGVHYELWRREAVVGHHDKICEAIAAKDGEAARAAMTTHVGEFHAFLDRYYPLLMDRPVRWEQVSD